MPLLRRRSRTKPAESVDPMKGLRRCEACGWAVPAKGLCAHCGAQPGSSEPNPSVVKPQRRSKRTNAVRRVCRNCGHEWVIPKKLAKVGKKVAFSALADPVAASAAARNVVQMNTCTKCGSVSYFTERPKTERRWRLGSRARLCGEPPRQAMVRSSSDAGPTRSVGGRRHLHPSMSNVQPRARVEHLHREDRGSRRSA
jgi:hypothetical protein